MPLSPHEHASSILLQVYNFPVIWASWEAAAPHPDFAISEMYQTITIFQLWRYDSLHCVYIIEQANDTNFIYIILYNEMIYCHLFVAKFN